MFLLADSVTISASAPVVVEEKDYTALLEQINRFLPTLAAEIQNHAQLNGKDHSELLKKLDAYNKATNVYLAALGDTTDSIKIDSEQIKTFLAKIDAYLPEITNKIQGFESAALEIIGSTTGSLSQTIVKESDETQALLTQLLSPKNTIVRTTTETINTGSSWKKLLIPTDTIQYSLICLENPKNLEYVFEEEICPPGLRIVRPPMNGGGNSQLLYSEVVAELPPDTKWIVGLAATSKLQFQITELDNSPAIFGQGEVEVPADLAVLI